MASNITDNENAITYGVVKSETKTTAQLLAGAEYGHELISKDLVEQGDENLLNEDQKTTLDKLVGIESTGVEIDKALTSWSFIKKSSSFLTLQEAFDSLTINDSLDIDKDYTEDNLIISQPYVTVFSTNGSKISSNAVDNIVLKILGSDSKVSSLVFDGKDKARTGISIESSNVSVFNNEVKSIMSTTTASTGITCTDTATGYKIYNNNIHDIKAVLTGNNGESIGASTAIWTRAIANQLELSYITDNNIKNIRGREGVGIYTAGGGNIITNIIIQNNGIEDITRRALKIDTANNNISNNVYLNNLPFTELTNLQAGIESFGLNNVIYGNTLDTEYCSGIIVSTNSAGTKVVKNDVYCTDNDYIGWVQQQPRGIMSLSADVVIADNDVFGGYSSVELINAERTEVTGNRLTSYKLGTTGVRISGISDNSKIRNTILKSGSDSVAYSIGVRVDSENIDIDGVMCQYQNADSLNINTVRFYSGGDTSLVENVDGVGANTTVKDASNKTLLNNISHKNGSVGFGGKSYFGAMSPNDALSTRRFNKGDIVFTTVPVPGGEEGWKCVSSGTPGTWKKFGSIEA